VNATPATPVVDPVAGAGAGRYPVPDRAQVRAILKTTMLRSMRGRMMAGRSGKPRGLIFLVVMYGVLGIVLGMLAFIHPDVFSYSMIIWAFTFLAAGMTLVVESSTLMFDARDNDILGHRPIHPRTLLLARSLSLLLLALILGLAINLVPMFTGLAVTGAKPWFPLTHLVTLLLLVPFCAAVIVFAYGVMARFVSRRTFDTVASWTQVGVTAMLVMAYQLVPRLMDRMQGFHIEAANPLLLALPPTWFAALSQVMTGEGASPRMLVLATIPLIATPVLAWAALRYLAADYARQVSSLSETPAPAAEDAPATAARRGRGLRLDALLRFWLRDPIERGAFRLASAYLTRDRDMRMRLYPQLASFLVLVVIAIIDRKTGPRFGPLMSLFIASTLPASAMMTLKMSPQFAAADLFRYTPLTGTASLFHGVRKATLVILVLPCVLVSGLTLWFGLSDRSGLSIALPALVALPTLSLAGGLFGGDYLPLSLAPASGRQGAVNVGMMFVGAVWLAIFAGLAIIAEKNHWFWWLLGFEVVVLALLHPLLLHGIRARPLNREDS